MPRLERLAVLAVLIPLAAAATDVYRHVDKDGIVHYSDQPPTKNAKPIVLPPIQVVGPASTPASGGASNAAANGSTAKEDAGLPQLGASIVSPLAEETFRGDDRRVPVAVRLREPLPEGYGLLYMLDGSPQNLKATRQLNFTMEGVERGEHMISVATVDARGREVARGVPVIVHMKPPTVALTEQRKKPTDPGRPSPLQRPN